MASELHVDAIKHSGGTSAMTIDSSGRVLTPARPSFYAFNLSFSGDGSAEEGTGGTIDHNIGSHYNSSNGRFTAPIAGVYQFMASIQGFNSGSTTYVALIFNKNGTNYGPQSALGYYNQTYNNHGQVNLTALFNLNANDYIQLHASLNARNTTQNYFGGYLIG